jgi:hypothetical protein
MKSWHLPNRRRLSIVLLVLLIPVCILALWKLASATALGKGDFIGYWSAAYLLHEGHNPYDPAGMMEIQQTLIHSGLDFVVMAWNPPTLFVFMLPLAWLPFTAAKAAWFVINVIILLAVILLLARLYLPPGGRAFLAFCLLGSFFPQVLVAIIMGQVTFLVLLGVVCSMALIRRGLWFWAGASLILTTVKPHMALLVVPYLLFYMAYRRKWQGWLGLLAAAAICITALFLFRPPWLADLIHIFAIAPLHWATPTVGGVLSFLHLTEAMRYMVVLLLPLAWFLARKQSAVNLETAVALLTVITVPATFYGWSYDQSILLIPMAQIIGWLLLPSHPKLRVAVIAAVLVSILINWIQRIMNIGEVYYFWIPLFWAGVYGICIAAEKASGPAKPAAEPV